MVQHERQIGQALRRNEKVWFAGLMGVRVGLFGVRGWSCGPLLGLREEGGGMKRSRLS